MSDVLNTFDSNGVGGDDNQDINMASPSQSSPMPASSTGTTGGAASVSNTTSNNTTSSSSNSINANAKSTTGPENQPVRK